MTTKVFLEARLISDAMFLSTTAPEHMRTANYRCAHKAVQYIFLVASYQHLAELPVKIVH
jgi:hypothetical protein